MSKPEHSKRWREKNRAYVNKSAMEYYWRNREAILAKKATPEGKARAAANMRRARKAKPELYKAAWKRWNDAHPGVKAARDKRAYERRKANGKATAYHKAKYARQKAQGLYPVLLARGLASGKRQRERASDCYVRCLLVRTNAVIPRKELPTELVELKRADLLLKRELKTKKHK